MKILFACSYIRDFPLKATIKYLMKYEPEKKFYVYANVYLKKYKKMSAEEYLALPWKKNSMWADFVCLNDLGDTYEVKEGLVCFDKAIQQYFVPNSKYNKGLIEIIESMDAIDRRGATIEEIPDGKRFFIDENGTIKYPEDIKWQVAGDNFVENDEDEDIDETDD